MKLVGLLIRQAPIITSHSLPCPDLPGLWYLKVNFVLIGNPIGLTSLAYVHILLVRATKRPQAERAPATGARTTCLSLSLQETDSAALLLGIELKDLFAQD